MRGWEGDADASSNFITQAPATAQPGADRARPLPSTVPAAAHARALCLMYARARRWCSAVARIWRGSRGRAAGCATPMSSS